MQKSCLMTSTQLVVQPNSVEPIAAAENGMNKAPKMTLPEQPHQLKKFKFSI